MPLLIVARFSKVSFHLTAIGCFRPFPSSASFIEGNQCCGNAQPFSAEPVIMLGIIAGIGQEPDPCELLGWLGAY